ncbi:MAG: ammonium transporter [Acidimicrobiales bacterium]|nr:ammonium transporter [Acidimicrobiales bacterium]
MASTLVVMAGPVAAQESNFDRFNEVSNTLVLDNIFIFVCAVLVFLMQAGFAMVEAGLTRAKNAANIMMKNLMDASLGVLVFALVGWGIAYPGDFGIDGWFGFAGFGVKDFFGTSLGDISSDDFYPLIPSVDFFFQAAFAAAAATIVSGAVAGRTKFKGYLVYTVVITALIYPVVVSWQWGGGWLSERGFVDFAGSGLVHMTGGVAALMGAIVIGPRIGKFGEDGKPRAIPGHSIPLAILGVFLLFIGWFGFNPGSQLQADAAVPALAVLTAFAAGAGAVTAMGVSWLTLGKPDVSMAGNGMLAGLVAICSGIGDLSPIGTLITGAVAGLLVVFAVLTIERAGIDDPVGAFSVHGVCGFWGLLATGLLSSSNSLAGHESSPGLLLGGGGGLFVDQLVGGVAIAIFVAVTSGVLFVALKATNMLRVDPEEEIAGLDVAEHGSPGYAVENAAGLTVDLSGRPVVGAPSGTSKQEASLA